MPVPLRVKRDPSSPAKPQRHPDRPKDRSSGSEALHGLASPSIGCVPGPFADVELAAFVSQPGPAFAQLDVATIREGIAQRARSRVPGPGLDTVVDLQAGGRPARGTVVVMAAPGDVVAGGRAGAGVGSDGAVVDQRQGAVALAQGQEPFHYAAFGFAHRDLRSAQVHVG